jgi:hypothetical protein
MAASGENSAWRQAMFSSGGEKHLNIEMARKLYQWRNRRQAAHRGIGWHRNSGVAGKISGNLLAASIGVAA